MPQSTTLYVGLEVHQASLAGADVAQEPGAEVTDRGTLGTRQGDLEQLIRKMPSKATPLSAVIAILLFVVNTMVPIGQHESGR
jgi:hypothetical protein